MHFFVCFYFVQIEISASAVPPIAKIMDYGKFEYERSKKEKVAKDPKAAKKPSRKKTAKESRMKAYWGVYNQGMKRLAMFEYSDKKAAEKKAADLMASSRTNHFIQLVKEAITE